MPFIIEVVIYTERPLLQVPLQINAKNFVLSHAELNGNRWKCAPHI